MLNALSPDGELLRGDRDLLLRETVRYRSPVLLALRSSEGGARLADEIEDEFFWDMEWSLRELESKGFRASERRFSELSWGIIARLRD